MHDVPACRRRPVGGVVQRAAELDPVRGRRAAALQIVGARHTFVLPGLRHDLDLSIDAYAGDLDVTTCSLDEPDKAAPKDHTFVRSKLSWMTIADGLPAYPTTRPAGQ